MPIVTLHLSGSSYKAKPLILAVTGLTGSCRILLRFIYVEIDFKDGVLQ